MTEPPIRQIVPVVGVTFAPDYPESFYALAAADRALNLQRVPGRLIAERLTAVLIREANNRYDPNAIGVHVTALGSRGQIGHLRRGDAEVYAPLIDRGEKFQAWVEWVRIDPDHPDKPGIDIGIRWVKPEPTEGGS